MITGGMKFFKDSLCLSTNGASAVASSGTPVENNCLDKNPLSYWTSVGSNDATEETLTVTFPSAMISRLLLLDHNWKSWAAQYWNGSGYVDFTSVNGIEGLLPQLTLTSSTPMRLAVAVYPGIRGLAKGTVTAVGVQVGDTVTVNNSVVFTARDYSQVSQFSTVANTSSFLNGKYVDVYEGFAPGTPVRIWFSTAGVGSAPAVPAGGRLLNVDLANNDADTVVAAKIGAVALADPGLFGESSSNVATVSNNAAGPVTTTSMGTSTFTLTLSRVGTNLLPTDFNMSTENPNTANSFVAQVTAYLAFMGVLSAAAASNVATLAGQYSPPLSSSSSSRLPVLVNKVSPVGVDALDTTTVKGVIFTARDYSQVTQFSTVANTSGFLNGLYIDVYEGVSPGTPVRIYFTTASVGTVPAVPIGGRLLNCDLANNDTDATVATKLAAVALADPGFFGEMFGPNITEIANNTSGQVLATSMGTSTFTITFSRFGRTLLATDFNMSTENIYTAKSLAAQINAHPSLTGIVSAVPSTTAVVLYWVLQDDSSYFEFDAVTTTRLQFKIDTTKVVDAQKFIASIIATNELGTLSGYPIVNGNTLSRNARTMQMLSGRVNVVKSIQTASISISFDTYPTAKAYAPDMDLMFTLSDQGSPFLVWMCGGRRGPKYFGYTARGWRLKDVYRMQFDPNFTPLYVDNYLTNGVSFDVTLNEHV